MACGRRFRGVAALACLLLIAILPAATLMRGRTPLTQLLEGVQVERIEVLRLYPGCAPEHDRELIATVTSKLEIREVLAKLKKTKKCKDAHGKPAARDREDGRVAYEYKFYLSDEGVLSYILSEALTAEKQQDSASPRGS